MRNSPERCWKLLLSSRKTCTIVLDFAGGKSSYVAAEVANWRIKWVVGVAHLPVTAPWKEMSTIPTGQKVEQMMKLILIQEQSGDFAC